MAREKFGRKISAMLKDAEDCLATKRCHRIEVNCRLFNYLFSGIFCGLMLELHQMFVMEVIMPTWSN
jgi:hypothetical protein